MHVLIVGGEVVGLACAHALAGCGAEVTVCEAGMPGGGNTGHAAGGIRMQFSTRVNVDLSLASVPVWESFADEFGVDIDYRRSGYLFLARTEATAAAFRENIAMQADAGTPGRVLSPAEAAEHLPEFRTESFVAAAFSAADGIADSHSAAQGYSDAVRATGVGLPLTPRRRQITVVEPEGDLPADVPLTIDLDTGACFRPERGRTAVVGGRFSALDPDVDPDRFDESMDVEWAVEMTERADDAAAYFDPETRIRNGWAGPCAVTPDHHAILDEAAPSLVVAADLSGHGFQHTPVTGETVADLGPGEDACKVGVSVLSFDRFEPGETLRERNVA